jgi:hypothetical protein
VLQRHPLLSLSGVSRDIFVDAAMTLLDIFERLSDVGARATLLELGRCWYVMFDSDRNGKFLVNNPVGWADGLPGERDRRRDLYSAIMNECCRPGVIDQSEAGTCTVTSMQYVRCRQSPAEYVRILTGLSSVSGCASSSSGQMLRRVVQSVPKDKTTRSPSERTFQAALMMFARGRISIR